MVVSLWGLQEEVPKRGLGEEIYQPRRMRRREQEALGPRSTYPLGIVTTVPWHHDIFRMHENVFIYSKIRRKK